MRVLQIILGVALLGSLVLAGARIYRRLPATSAELNQTVAGGAQRDLTIVFNSGVSLSEARVRLYPIDFHATERDYLNYRRSDRSLEDFLAMRLKNVTAINVEIDSSGHGVARYRRQLVDVRGLCARKWRVDGMAHAAHNRTASPDDRAIVRKRIRAVEEVLGKMLEIRG